jgi:hypothetical protein
MDAKLTGSLAIAGQGDIIYRNSEEPIHDVDFTVKSKEDFEDILDKVESMNGVPAHYGWSNEEKQYTTYAYIIPLEGLTVEVLERDFNRGNGWVTQFNLRDKNGNIVEKTKKGGAEIVSLLRDGSAYYAPAKAASLMAEAVLSDTKQIYPCSVMLDGEYGYKNTVSGVPVMIGATGAEKVIEANLNDDQDRKFAKSVGSVVELVNALYANNFYTK